ncbi:MAG TPA: 30S ribosomal protein S20 [Candidatus Paceibacterota bacterium]|nr:30S ribosomal protein S20 [Candidatus Paceibacterota bacterium]
MPITASAKKAARQNIRRRLVNREYRDAVRTAVKTFRKLVSEKKISEAKASLPKIYKTLDKVAKSNVITKNKAARLKSRLTALVNKK